MDMLALSCFAASLTALSVQTGSCALAAIRCRPREDRPLPALRPGISIVRPLCGLEPFSQETLRSTFHLDYPDYEILFCVAEEGDPVLPLVRALIAAHPGRAAEILIGKDALGENPKLNNMAKGFRAARFGHVVFVDSNVLMPPDYLDQLAVGLEAGAGMVSAPPIGSAPRGVWAEIECAFLNTYQARIQYCADMLGFGFAQGKTLFFRREDLENGGLARLADEPAEDAAATKMMRAKGRHIRLAGPFLQPIGPRTLRQMWSRQLRWARLRRSTFPVLYASEIFAGPLWPAAALLLATSRLELGVAGPALAFLALWYGAELLLARAAGWKGAPLALILRDALLPAIFLAGYAGRNFEWHGHRMSAQSVSRLAERVWG